MALPLLRPLVLLVVLLSPTLARGQERARGPQADLEARVGALLERSCASAGCHVGPTPQMGMDLRRGTFFSATVGARSVERPDLLLVDPGHPERSYLQMKVEGAAGIIGLAMPPAGDRLSADEVAAVRAWIAQLTEADLGRAGAAPPPEPDAFLGWKVVNLPTTRAVTRGDLLFAIGHRFNPEVGAGVDAFFGIDGSSIVLLSLGYAATDRLLVSLGRSNADDDVELGLRYGLARQRPGGWPLSAGAHAAVNWFSEVPPEGASRLRGEALKLSAQLVLARAFGDRAGATVVPGLLLNPSTAEEGEGPLVTLGLGGRVRVYGNLALVAEWVPIVTGYARTRTFGNDNRFDSWAGGLEVATAGHVFQVVASNSVGLATDQYLRGGDLDIREPDFRLGFNIFRVIDL